MLIMKSIEISIAEENDYVSCISYKPLTQKHHKLLRFLVMKDKNTLFCIISTMAADKLVAPGDSASVVMVLAHLTQNILGPDLL